MSEYKKNSDKHPTILTHKISLNTEQNVTLNNVRCGKENKSVRLINY
jgi:hypothetical protein